MNPSTEDEQLAELLSDQEQETERQRRRATFFANAFRELAGDVVTPTLDECAAAIQRDLRGAPARGVCEGAPSAWEEAADIAKTDGHMLFETLVEELHGLAADAIRKLPTERLTALWVRFEPAQSASDSELWSRVGAEDVDPAKARCGGLESVERAIVRRVLDGLRETR